MAVLCKAVVDGLLLTLGLALLGWGAMGQGNRRATKQVTGGSTIYLGQERDLWRPLIYTTVNLSDVSSIKSSFQLQTFDPEGIIFYGDTKDGEDWFVLSLSNGLPLMQIKQGEMLLSVAGGPRLNDGKWHTLEMSSQEKFVILKVDGSDGLMVGMHSQQTEEAMSGELRMALGGILMDEKNMVVQVQPQMDGCVRKGSWLNLNNPWEMEADELRACHPNIQPGSYFSGTGFAIFSTSVFNFDTSERVSIELEGRFRQMDGTIFSVKIPGQDLTVALVANNNTQELTLILAEEKIKIKNTSQRLRITFEEELLQVFTEEPKLTELSATGLKNRGVFHAWKNSRLAIGSLLGEDEDSVGTQFLTGCLTKIKVQGKDLDLGLAVKKKSVTSHSCPA